MSLPLFRRDLNNLFINAYVVYRNRGMSMCVRQGARIFSSHNTWGETKPGGSCAPRYDSSLSFVDLNPLPLFISLAFDSSPELLVQLFAILVLHVSDKEEEKKNITRKQPSRSDEKKQGRKEGWNTDTESLSTHLREVTSAYSLVFLLLFISGEDLMNASSDSFVSIFCLYFYFPLRQTKFLKCHWINGENPTLIIRKFLWK